MPLPCQRENLIGPFVSADSQDTKLELGGVCGVGWGMCVVVYVGCVCACVYEGMCGDMWVVCECVCMVICDMCVCVIQCLHHFYPGLCFFLWYLGPSSMKWGGGTPQKVPTDQSDHELVGGCLLSSAWVRSLALCVALQAPPGESLSNEPALSLEHHECGPEAKNRTKTRVCARCLLCWLARAYKTDSSAVS